jgi:adenylate cyclase
LASGLVLFVYITAHLVNHSLGLVSLGTAEAGLEIAVEVWSSWPGTVLLYGAAAIHFLLALWSVYERRTFRLPPLELLRIALGFMLPILLIGHAANTRLAWELFQMPSDYARVVTNLWVADQRGMQLGLLAPGWLHGCLGLHFIFSRRPLYRRLRYPLFAFALLLPVFSGLGFIAMGRQLAADPAATAAALEYLSPTPPAERIALARWHNGLLIGYFAIIGATFGARAVRNALERGRKRLVSISYPGRTVRVPRGWSVLEASRGFHLPHASMCGR